MSADAPTPKPAANLPTTFIGGLIVGAILCPLLIVLAVLFLARPPAAKPPADSQPQPLAAAPAAAPAAYATCAACHGPQGEGMPALKSPRLAGLPDWYLSSTLRRYRSGQRGADPRDTGGAQMRPMAMTLAGDEGIAAVVAAIGGLRPSGPLETLAGGDAVRGKDLYTTCVACHGERGEGQPAVAGPPLARQHAGYLLTQLQHFRQGIRGADPADQAGHLMGQVAHLLPEGERTAQDLVAYLQSLP